MYSGVVKCPFILFMPRRSNVICGKLLSEGEERRGEVMRKRRGGRHVEGTRRMDPLSELYVLVFGFYCYKHL